MDQEDFDKIRKIKKESKEAYKDWSREDDDELINLFFDNIPVGEMALQLKRTKGAVRARIRKMELIHIKKKASPSSDSKKK